MAPGKGVWEPLPLIVYGYAIHPLSPSHRDTRISNRTRLSTTTESSTFDNIQYKDVVSLEVGDEIYAFEKYTPKGKECEGVWYRGYVVVQTRRPTVNWSAISDPSSSTSKPPKAEDPQGQQVFIGIFPASHIYVRDELSDAEGRLADLASMHAGTATGTSTGTATPSMHTANDEEEVDTGRHRTFRLGPPPDQANSSRAALPVYSQSIRSSSPAESHVMKPLPPRPTLKTQDDTASGAEQPIIDEIASALREWHTLMFQYLARRDYKLFHTVREHIEALHIGRRQLLAQTLSAEETVGLRRECVARLVSGNIVQGLDVIVRHPTWGALVTVDIEGDIDSRSWVSAIRMYAMQTSLAYMDVNPSVTSKPGKSPTALSVLDFSSGPVPTPAHSAFSDLSSRGKGHSRVFGSLGPSQPSKPAAAKFYHLFLELKAFVASPCAPGETVELFFSLYNRAESKFVTEDFVVILNHNGRLARDPAAHIRTLFTDLVQSDVQDPIYLVCRIVRNGALKLGSNLSSGVPMDRRGSEGDSTALNGYNTGSNGTRGYSNNDASYSFRRPFGCAVLELTQLSQMTADGSEMSATKEHTMPIFVPVAANESGFSMLHQDIIENYTKEFEKSPRADMIAVSTKIYHGETERVVKENTSLLQNTPLTLRLGFPDVVFPGDIRNELYIKLWSGDFSPSHTGSARLSVANFARGQIASTQPNIQVSIEVRDQDGQTVGDALYMGSGEPALKQYNSIVFRQNNQPTFGELIKIKLPLRGVPSWHLFFTFRNRSSRERQAGRVDAPDRPYAFAFLPLFPDEGAFPEDGEHRLILYRADRLSHISPEMYLSSPPCLPASQRPNEVPLPNEMSRLTQPIRDHLTLRSSLCSTRFTQNSVLLSLLKWEKIKDNELLSTVLAKFTFVGEVEIVKFLRDIFDALFGILVSRNNQSGEMDHLVFDALVTVLGIVQDRRFSNFRPVLDVYIEKHFNCASASSHMLHSMNKLLANPTANETASALRAALKVWHYIFKFIARSRELQKAKELGMGSGATAEHLEMTFKKEVQAHLSEVNLMMSTSSPPSIIGTQTIALQHFTAILPELAKIFSTVELVTIATAFANAVLPAKGKIVVWKLIMYLQLVKGFLFDNPQSRSLLVEAIVIHWIKPHFGRFDDYAHTQAGDSDTVRDAARVNWIESIRLCITIIAVMLDKLQQNLISPATISDRNLLRQEQDNIEYLVTLLPRVLDSYRELQNPLSIRAIERNRSSVTATATAPVTFPESYPFSLLAQQPTSAGLRQYTSGLGASDAIFNPSLGEAAIVFLTLILSSPKKNILGFLDEMLEIEGRDNTRNFLSQLFKVSTSIIDNDAFPHNWLNVNILAHKVLIKIMDPVATLMEREFVPHEHAPFQFDAALWQECVYVLLKLCSSEQLMIEEFSPQRRRTVWRLAGDIRGEGAAVLLRLWDALGWSSTQSTGSATPTYGGYQIALNVLVGNIVNLCLSHHDQLRHNAVQILYSMIVSEYHTSGHFDEIENEVVSKLDSLFMSDSRGDDISRAFFIGQLRHLFDSPNIDEQLRERITIFLEAVDQFLELLLSVRALPEGEEFADDRVIATLRLMNFIRRIGRDEMYIKYVHQLVNMHLQSQNYIEAALTLKLHSDLHEWDLNVFVEPMEDLGLPQQSQFHRKETLSLLILDYLGKGKAWESAIEICKELAFQHEEVTFNYARLAEILRHRATLLEHIITDQRYYPDYFRVAFYGNFPDAIRGKRFIYRGYEWEKFGAFCERMLNKHPGAQLLKSMGDPPVDIRFGTDQYIQCTAVNPEPNRSLPVFTNPDVPVPVRTYYENSAIQIFSCSTPVVRQTRDGSDEVWIEKTYFSTEESFPTVLRRSEIVDSEVIYVSPVENALQEVEEKTKELQKLHLRYSTLTKTTQGVSTNPLSMALNNAVDAPPTGGITSFRQVFLAPEYLARHPDRIDQIDKLRQAIDDQVRIIDSCLRLHGQLCPPEMLTFHETMERFFRKNFPEEIERLSVDTERGLSRDAARVSRSYAYAPSQFQGSLTDRSSLKRSMSTTSTSRPQFIIPPLQLGNSIAGRSSLTSHTSPMGAGGIHASLDGTVMGMSKQTPLQRHMAQLTRHGMTGMASGPENGSDSLSAGSPHESLVNVLNALGSHSGVGFVGSGGASFTTSGTHLGSVGGSLKGRFSKLGSLSFGRRDG
ncbi:cytoplasmic protein [Neolentinus lepideus HHB14362 ss-1]|uniref:Cytoplasmic protein n=1 Tax=Neolentinus lepideus HHB14362 ss-1 TaxID=1314782 RepID=A0A165UD78_9AGAM|nr:cytoplasmic protein [Neolentinus lepideus HHB14362 ss-1]